MTTTPAPAEAEPRPLNRCPRRDTPHDAHPFRLYLLGGLIPTTCPGLTADAWLADEIAAGRVCGDHERPNPCQECR